MIVQNVKSDVDIGSPGPEKRDRRQCREEKGEEEQVGEAAQRGERTVGSAVEDTSQNATCSVSRSEVPGFRKTYKQEIGGISYAYIHPDEPDFRAYDILLQSTP